MQRELAGSFSMTLPTWFDLSPSGQIFQGRCIRRKRLRGRQLLRMWLIQYWRWIEGRVSGSLAAHGAPVTRVHNLTVA